MKREGLLRGRRGHERGSAEAWAEAWAGGGGEDANSTGE